MQLKIVFTIGLIAWLFIACEKKMTEQEVYTIGMPSSKKLAPYTRLAGFDTRQIALSTNEENVTGLALVQYLRNETDTVAHKIWQHPSWKKMGHMGSITSTADGTAFTAPIPVINTLDRNLSNINVIYYVDKASGEMKTLINLPKPDSSSTVVPYGVLGLYYDDHGHKLYASSVAGSTRDQEKGVIYVIDTQKKQIVDKIEGIDAFGLMVLGYTGQKRLYYGLARKPEVHSIELNKEGLFKGDSKQEFSLAQLGPRGNDKARRMRIDKYGNLFVFGLDFNYNLSAQTIKPETIYRFNYTSDSNKWSFMNVMP